MFYAYVRVSTDKQDSENQRFEILKWADDRKVQIGEWVVETVSGAKKVSERKLGDLLQRCSNGDSLVVTEISRLGRSLLDVMTTLHFCMEENIHVFTCKEKFELADNINSKVLAFAFSLAAEIERKMISQRTKEALARKKSEGVRLGRPKGSLGTSKLSGKEQVIKEYVAKGISKASMAKLLDVHPGTIAAFITTRGLMGINKGDHPRS